MTVFNENPSLLERIDSLVRQYEGDAVADVLMEAKRRIKRAEDCLLSFTPSGSEYFNRDGDGFRVDVDACERVIRENYNKGHRAMIENARLRNTGAQGVSDAPKQSAPQDNRGALGDDDV